MKTNKKTEPECVAKNDRLLKHNKKNQKNNNQVVSKERVAKHGEVFTAEREVNAMLDLVGDDCLRIDSRFLEPACGTGNFLIEILRRKLAVVGARYKNNQTLYEKNALLAVSSIYGIDILADSLAQCKERLKILFCEEYQKFFGKDAAEDVIKSAEFLLEKNIVLGDALTMSLVDKSGGISFVQWSLIADKFKGREYKYCDLQNTEPEDDLLAESSHKKYTAAGGQTVFITEPVKEYPLTHYRRLYELN